MDNLYFYKAYVTGVYDGDSITVDIDLGMNIVIKNRKIRLYGINTPELRGDEREEGLKSRDWLREKILDKDIMVQTIKDKSGKYGRLLGKIWIDGTDINALLVENKLAVYREY